MNSLLIRGASTATAAIDDLATSAHTAINEGCRRDRVVWVIVVIALAIIAAVGLAVAWWLACRAIGKYPVISVPAWGSAGSYRAWCS